MKKSIPLINLLLKKGADALKAPIRAYAKREISENIRRCESNARKQASEAEIEMQGILEDVSQLRKQETVEKYAELKQRVKNANGTSKIYKEIYEELFDKPLPIIDEDVENLEDDLEEKDD